ncbi:MAG: DUF3604 domain-containing protein [Lachnospirales bacterium]
MNTNLENHININEFGTFNVKIADTLVVSSEIEWILEYKANNKPVPKGTLLKIIVPAYQHQRSETYLQTYDYWKPNYIYVEQPSNITVAEVSVQKIDTKFQHIHRWDDSSRAAVIEFREQLEINETIEIHFGGINRPWLYGHGTPSHIGEASFKRKGTYLTYETTINWAGNGKPVILKLFPKVKIIPDEVAYIKLISPSVIRPKELCQVKIIASDRFNNPIFDFSTEQLKLVVKNIITDELVNKDTVTVEEVGFTSKTEGCFIISVTGTKLPIKETIVLCSESANKLYWGDTHIHSNLTANIRDNDGGAYPDDVYTYGKEVANLDFMVLSEQTFEFNNDRDLNIDEETWNTIGNYADKYLEEGSFVTFPGIELHSKRGDTVIVFGDSLSNFDYPKEKVKEIKDIWKYYNDKPLITIPHLHRYAGGRQVKDQQEDKFSGFNIDNWAPTDNNIECLAEIYSSQWGRFEHNNNPMLLKARDNVKGNTINDFLKMNKRWGFTANSDGHDGNPGYGGITGVYAMSNTREDIFSALKNRQTIASTHERAIINCQFSNNKFTYMVASPSKIKSIELVCDSDVVETIICKNKFVEGEFEIPLDSILYIYLRVNLENRHILWSSPIWFDSNY